MKLVFWLPNLNPHFMSTFSYLQKIVKDPITFVVWKNIEENRKNFGWKEINQEELQVIRLYEEDWFHKCSEILSENKNAIHLFWGFWSVSQYFWFILRARSQKIRVAVFNEPFSTSPSGYNKNGVVLINQIKVLLRPVLYRLTHLILSILPAQPPYCIFAISKIAEKQFIDAGYAKESIFQFGYFVDKIDSTVNKEVLTSSDPLRLVFVGNLLKRKGLDIVVRSLQSINLNSTKVSLDVFGFGDPENLIPKEQNYITYKGVLTQQEVQSTIAKYDFLILPSRHDGWGVVVNEALLQGVPVIVSSAVGAKCLVEESEAGIVFESENSDDLTAKLNNIIISKEMQEKMHSNAKVVAEKILPAEAAEYLAEVLQRYFYEEKEKEKTKVKPGWL